MRVNAPNIENNTMITSKVVVSSPVPQITPSGSSSTLRDEAMRRVKRTQYNELKPYIAAIIASGSSREESFENEELTARCRRISIVSSSTRL